MESLQQPSDTGIAVLFKDCSGAGVQGELVGGTERPPRRQGPSWAVAVI